MKKILIVILASAAMLQAMQAPGPNLTIENKTIWDIRVVYDQGGKELIKDIGSEKQGSIYNPRTITNLRIIRSGILGSLIPIEKQSDETPKIREKVRLYPDANLVLSISTSEGVKGSVGELITSVEHESSKLTKKADSMGILQHFPKVREIITETSGLKGFYGLRSPSIEAYNLFGFTNMPSKKEIEEAYEGKRAKLAEIAGGSYAYAAADRERAEDAVEMLDNAYKVLTQPENQAAKAKLQELIQERFITPKKY